MRKIHEEIAVPAARLERTIGKIVNVMRVSGGLVNYVYRIDGDKATVFAKVRRSTFSEVPDIAIEPKDIRHERRALTIFSKEFPDVFPKQLAFYPRSSTLILSDIMRDGNTMENLLNSNKFTNDMSYNLGKLLGKVHNRFRSSSVFIREDGDEEFYSKNLLYRLGCHNNEILNDLTNKLKAMPKQLILGDLSPKNICISSGLGLTLCDLENAHRGNAIFDVGFAAAHVVLHSLGDAKRSSTLLSSFLKGYASSNGLYYSTELKLIILGTMLYRLDNKIIPYNLDISLAERTAVTGAVKDSLYNYAANWNDMARKFENKINTRKAIGAIVGWKDNPNYILLVKKVKTEDVSKKEIAPEWDIPKGGIKDNEEYHQALFRELDEEVGSNDFELIEKLPFRMDFKLPTGSRWERQETTLYYLEYNGSHAVFCPKTDEIAEARMVKIDEAKNLIAYKTTSMAVAKAEQLGYLHRS